MIEAKKPARQVARAEDFAQSSEWIQRARAKLCEELVLGVAAVWISQAESQGARAEVADVLERRVVHDVCCCPVLSQVAGIDRRGPSGNTFSKISLLAAGRRLLLMFTLLLTTTARPASHRPGLVTSHDHASCSALALEAMLSALCGRSVPVNQAVLDKPPASWLCCQQQDCSRLSAVVWICIQSASCNRELVQKVGNLHEH